MMTSRRRFLQRGLAGSALLFQPFLLNRVLHGAEPGDSKKLLFIFQRGGNDGLNTVIPRGDSEYNATTRPTLYIAPGVGLDLGNNFAELHPALAPMMSLYHSERLTGVPGPGNLAVIHRVGYANQSRSHFDSQSYWEKGVPRDASVRDGVFYRQLAQSMDLDAPDNAFVAAAISSSQIEALQGAHAIPNFRRSEDFAVLGDDGGKFLGELPSVDAPVGKGVRGLYTSPGSLPNSRYAQLVKQTGQSMTNTLGTLEEAVAQGAYTPANGAIYPDSSFGEKLQEAAMLMKRTPVRVVGCNLSGFDTHSGQGSAQGDHPELLADIASGFQALYLDLQDQWDDLIIVTMTEFGRTSRENGAQGTDHAEASTMFVAGGGVKGGTYNCDATTWADGDIFSKRGRYLARRTDFRAVFGEIFTKHFGNSTALLDTIMPGYSLAADDIPGDFETLGIL